MVRVAILCGGIGSRLWPLSRKERPKQFMKLPGAQYNLFQETLMRINHLQLECQELILVSNVEIKDEIVDCVLNLSLRCPITFIWEPFVKNTGPAIGTLIHYLSLEQQLFADDSCLVWPSDHLLCMDTFNQSLKIAQQYIDQSIITFGVTPVYAETGYGYVVGCEDYQISQFIEKPPLSIATELIQRPNCYWNSGMFYFKASTVMHEYRRLNLELMNVIQQAMMIPTTTQIPNKHIYIDAMIYAHCDDIPFDKLIMEKTDKGRVIPLEGAWSDIGSWDSISKLKRSGTAAMVNAPTVIQIDNQDCHIYNYNERQIVSAIGLKNICVINTPDAVLISDLSQTQKVKNIYQHLDQIHSQSVQRHIKTDHSWGMSEKLDSGGEVGDLAIGNRDLAIGNRYCVHKCLINPRKSTPQKYQNDAYMSVMPLQGSGQLLVGEEQSELVLHQPQLVSRHTLYRIMNTSETISLVLLIVQSGL